MKKFLTIQSFFLIPIIFLQVFTWMYYTTSKGDLLRMGYIFNRHPHYRDVFLDDLKEQKICYKKITDLPQKRDYKIITIGDSFSEQGGIGYQNNLAKRNRWDILHIDRKTQDNKLFNLNQIQFLLYLVNGDFFDHYHSDFVILQNIERHFVEHASNFDVEGKLNYSDLIKIIQNGKKEKSETQKEGIKFPSQSIFKFPFYSYFYFKKNDYCFEEKVNKTTLDKKLFSPNINELLFYHTDLESLKQNNDTILCKKLNELLNLISDKLDKKNIKLIVLPSPDKYDFYYENIENKSKYERPLFFENMNKLNKRYIFIDSRTLLRKQIDNIKNIYYYDDTHWTSIGASLIAKELEKKIITNAVSE